MKRLDLSDIVEKARHNRDLAIEIAELARRYRDRQLKELADSDARAAKREKYIVIGLYAVSALLVVAVILSRFKHG